MDTVKSNLIYGVLFLLPVAVIVLLIAKLVDVLAAIAKPNHSGSIHLPVPFWRFSSPLAYCCWSVLSPALLFVLGLAAGRRKDLMRY